MIDPTEAELRRAYAGRAAFVTGHTGFMGGWLAIWLGRLGASVTGYALPPEDARAIFAAAGVARRCRHVDGDVRDARALGEAVAAARPDFVFHLAAQAIVRRGYQDPLGTIETNVLGTANLLEAVRASGLACRVVVVTSDKCYENPNMGAPHREDDPMGGHDPYSSSKGAAELIASAFGRSFFAPGRAVRACTVRAGNVVGGGDRGRDRIVPDAVRALEAGRPVPVRNPEAVRPWQHVLEPIAGCLLLGARMDGVGTDHPDSMCGPWNLGPPPEDARPVRRVVEAILARWGSGAWEVREEPDAPHEAAALWIDSGRARERVGWRTRWGFEETIARTVDWYRAQIGGDSPERLAALCERQIDDYLGA